MTSTPISTKRLSVPSPNISNFDGTTPEQSKTYSIIGRNIMKVTGKPSLEKFERLRARLKSPNVDNFYKEQYADELVKLQTAVLSAFTSMKKELSTIEAELSVADLTDSNADLELQRKRGNLRERLVLADKLLLHWKITVHL